MNIIIFIIILLVLVVSHEWGHFIVAKKSGIRVDEFAFGMGPKLLSWKKGETTYRLNAFPIGGYVKIFGENPDEESINGPDKNRSFVSKPKYMQASVMFAGIFMNLLVAWVLLSVGFMTGLPSSVASAPNGAKVSNAELTITNVMKDSPAELAGLKAGDKITHLKTEKDETDVPSKESLQYFIRKHGGEDILVTYNRGTEQKEVHIIPTAGLVDGAPGIGVNIDLVGTLKLPVHKAFFEGLKLTWYYTTGTVKGFYDLIVGNVSASSLSGPVGIVGIVGDATKLGFVYLLSFTALISINLAVINLVPFPALDGGRLLFLLIEKIKGSRITPKVANCINAIGFVLLMILMVVITFNDVVKLF